MKTTRRAMLVGSTALAVGCQSIRSAPDPRQSYFPATPITTGSNETKRALKILNRAGFGPTPASVADVISFGVDGWIDRQLTAPPDVLGPLSYVSPAESIGLLWRINALECLRPGAGYELRDQSQKRVLSELTAASILRASYSQWQLRERMCQFWTNHFSIYARKVVTAPTRKTLDAELLYLLSADQHTVIRPNALGTFQALLSASTQSPAMLGFLDNQLNKRGNVNENYARELLELHTLGVKNGYSQSDVKNVANALSGWTIEDRFLRRVGSLKFDITKHLMGTKVVLGTQLTDIEPKQERSAIVNLLAAHPSTARFISIKLIRQFCGLEGVTERLIESTQKIFISTDGNIKNVVKHILLSDDFFASPQKFKPPFDYLTSSLRVTNANTSGFDGIQYQLEHMGQPAHQWPMPNGYPDTETAWSGNMLPRWQFALALGSNTLKGTTTDRAATRYFVADRFDHLSLSERLMACIASPDFQWA